jgi:murein tripeptide amidase MpaA
MLTSNLPFQEWTEVLGSERLTGALLDRLTHHVHILEMNGDSYRLKQSRRKRARPANLSSRLLHTRRARRLLSSEVLKEVGGALDPVHC